MQFLIVSSLTAMATLASMQRAPGPEVVAVRAVVDGGTIDVAGYGRIRLAGIRAPKAERAGRAGEPFGAEARARLEGMVTHRYVRLEFAPGASAAFVLLEDGTFVNAVLVGEGLARVSGHPPGARGEALARAQQEAQAARRGLWGARETSLGRAREPHNPATPNAQLTANSQLPKRSRKQDELQRKGHLRVVRRL